MVGKINYAAHVLKTIGRNEVSTREILDNIRSTVHSSGSDRLYSEVRKALTAGVKNNILEKRNGKYKLKLNNKENLQYLLSDDRSVSDTEEMPFTECSCHRQRRTGRSKATGRQRRRSGGRTKKGRSTKRSSRRQRRGRKCANGQRGSQRPTRELKVSTKVTHVEATKEKRTKRQRNSHSSRQNEQQQNNENCNATKEGVSTQERKQTEEEQNGATESHAVLFVTETNIANEQDETQHVDNIDVRSAN